SESIRVCLRCRPFSEKEKTAGFSRVVRFDSPTSLTITNPKNQDDTKQFTFDAVYDEESTQRAVYEGTAREIVNAVLQGFNGTVFVYGQTGTGKTFSMQGVPTVPDLRGIIPNAFHQIFAHIASSPDRQFLVRVSFLEIYNEEVRDLLVPPPPNGTKPAALEVKEHPETGVYVKDLQAFPVQSVADMDALMDRGNKSRSVAATEMNATSSRSHSIFTITIESSAPGPDGTAHVVAGKLHLVDLAGSERQSKTGAAGDRLKEAAKINLSLSALGNCIAALVDGGGSGHIPYRDSKLTRLLQDSLGGNAKTLMLATMSPASYNFDETLSTLRYANRAKNIKNKPRVNEDPKDALLREYQLEIQRLQEALKAKMQGGGAGGAPSALDPATLATLQQQIQDEKARLLASKDMAEDEQERLLDELDARAAKLEEERKARADLAAELAKLESALLMGGKDITARISEQELELERARAKAQEEAQRQAELRAQLDAVLEGNLQLEDSYANLQEEVDIKTRKLAKLWSKIEQVRQDARDIEQEWRSERADLVAAVRELAREVELKSTVLDLFVPEEERRKGEARLVLQQDDEW
ncbi:P-loop containing nucleoside triphosphate hydrolase protein, partial [Catenaria anguillulae PL171]